MFISVVIPTCHRNDLLARCLDCLAPGVQRGLLPACGEVAGDYEVVVSDDGSNETAQAMIAGRYPWVRWVAGPRRGPAANRNHGALEARGEWLAFVDDDCLPASEWLWALRETIQREPLEVVEGKTVCEGHRDDPFEEQVENLEGGVFWSCNLAVKREVFIAMNGFDEAFLEAGGEDMEFAWRIDKRRLRTRFAPGFRVTHPPRRVSWRKLWRRVFMIRWMVLYRLRTGQGAPMDAGAGRIVWEVVTGRTMELLRTTGYLVTRFDPGSWRRALFFQALGWIAFPAVVVHLVTWEFRFRKQLRTANRLPAMVPAEIRLSIALITHNGPDRLARCLESVRSQNVQPAEVIVSDDSDLEFAERTKAVAERFGCRYLAGPRRGLYANRNAAALACLGTHVRTMDDDHVIPAGHFELCLKAVASDPEAIWTTGEIGYVDGERYGETAVAHQLHPSGLATPPENPDDNWAIADGSTVYPASVFARGFRMVEGFSYGSSYLEFGAYLVHNGYRCRCIEGAMIDHYAGRSMLQRFEGFDANRSASYLYASFAYNLYFKPNVLRALRYLLSHLWQIRFRLAVVRQAPGLLLAVRRRWRNPPGGAGSDSYKRKIHLGMPNEGNA